MDAPIQFSIDGRAVEVAPGATVLAGARRLGIDIPTLCFNERCGPLTSCQACLVIVIDNRRRRLAPSCGLKAAHGMVIESETAEVHDARRTALELLFSDHVGDCLSPCQRLCPWLLNIPEMLRQIGARNLESARTTLHEALALPSVLSRLCHHPCEQGCRRALIDSPALIRDLERFLVDEESQNPAPRVMHREPASGKKVAVVGAGPVGLATAFRLVARGHGVTVLDRRQQAGGTLGDLPEDELPSTVLLKDLARLRELGIAFNLSFELGRDAHLPDLLSEFDAVLLATGAAIQSEATRLGVVASGAFIKTDPETYATSASHVFAAGPAAKAVKPIVRAMAEGFAAAECIHLDLKSQAPRRPEKPFSSVMGRLDPAELKEFLRHASSEKSASRDPSHGLNSEEASTEAARCLHCDCASSGHCSLQHYGRIYGVDPKRFKTERRPFKQLAQPGGVIFEPGKCIVCGICVKLTELACEPLGLSFIGRGFDVRVAAPFQQSFSDGLTKVAAECIAQCPTGALAAPSHNKAPGIAAADAEAAKDNLIYSD